MIKKIWLLAIFSCACFYGHSQSLDRFSLDLDIMRYAPVTGIANSQDYEKSFQFINGFTMNYQPSEKLNYKLGIRKLRTTLTNGGLYDYESTEVSDYEINTGLSYKLVDWGRLNLRLGLEAFGEFSKLQGLFMRDTPPPSFTIDHQKTYLGLAPSLSLSFRVLDRLSLFVSTRHRYGHVQLNPRQSSGTENLYPDQSFWYNSFESVKSLGVRIQL